MLWLGSDLNYLFYCNFPGFSLLCSSHVVHSLWVTALGSWGLLNFGYCQQGQQRAINYLWRCAEQCPQRQRALSIKLLFLKHATKHLLKSRSVSTGATCGTKLRSSRCSCEGESSSHRKKFISKKWSLLCKHGLKVGRGEQRSNLMLITFKHFTACESLITSPVCILICLLTKRPFHNWVYC